LEGVLKSFGIKGGEICVTFLYKMQAWLLFITLNYNILNYNFYVFW
jgi:hypothetical protein